MYRCPMGRQHCKQRINLPYHVLAPEKRQGDYAGAGPFCVVLCPSTPQVSYGQLWAASKMEQLIKVMVDSEVLCLG